jgi:hypothetical protein
MASAKQYWQAYEYAEERSKELAKTPEKARAPMQKELGDGYVAILPAAAAYYVGEANKNFDQDAYGICFVLCRMSEEMIQYARDCLMPLSTETTDWEKRASDSRRDAETRLSSTMLRTVVIGEFTPTTPENQALAAKVNELSTLLLSGGKDVARAAWGVIVEKAGTATKPKPSDYLVQAEVSVFLVADVPPQEMERSILKVHRDIREIPNPDYDKDRNPKAPKTVFSQEVFMYQSLRMQYAKRALLKMAVSCQQQGETANLLSLDTEFTNEDGRLEAVNMSSIEQSLDVPFVGPPRISETSSDLTVDPWPKAIPPRLSSEAEIRNAMMKFAAQSIVDKIVALVDRYPVDALAAEALKQQKLRNKLEAANLWGQCLKYCCSMASSAAEPAQEPPSWTSQKDATLRRMSELSATRWKDSDSSLLAKVTDIWSVAVRSTLEATETEH